MTSPGMVSAFAERNIIGTLFTTAHLLIIMGPLAAGFLTAREMEDEASPKVMIAGLLTGLVASIPTVIFILIMAVLFANGIDVRTVLVNVSQELLNFLTFNQGPVLGTLIFILVTTVMGGLGAVFSCLSYRLRISLLAGIAVTLMLGLFSENLSQILQH